LTGSPMDLPVFSLSIFPWALEGDLNILVREQESLLLYPHRRRGR